MTLTLPGADIRGYYQALGIQPPAWALTEASVRCFADPDVHRRGDRDPSCSVNLEHGAWHCHACGAAGGAFDAATARGYSDRGAIDLMVAYRLTEHRPYRRPNANIRRRSGSIPARPTKPPRTPVRDDERRLIGLLRYQPWPHPREPKMLATPGSRRALLPHPAAEPCTRVLLVEGEPDMIAARSRGLRAIATPGADSWRSSWARLLSGRQVTIIMDCDEQGRMAAATIANDLSRISDVHMLDLAPDRDDGYDLSDRLLEGWEPEVLWQ